jgi:hypothetical protein
MYPRPYFAGQSVIASHINQGHRLIGGGIILAILYCDVVHKKKSI